MKLLQELKNRLVKDKLDRRLKAQKNKNMKTRTLITKTFSEDEDLFLFI